MKTQVTHEIEEHVGIPADTFELQGDLIIPEEPVGLVLFAHGSGSSRHSPRNRFVAQYLNDHHLATLLIDLLSEDEEWIDTRTAQLRFNIPFLANRLLLAIDWLSNN